MSSLLNDVDNFLSFIGSPILSLQNLNRVWKAFMAYCMCRCVESFLAHGFTVTPQNVTAGFVFKCYPRGNPDNYSWFEVVINNERYELRLSIDAKDPTWDTNLMLNLDIVLIKPNSFNRTIIASGFYVVDAQHDLLFFAECKNLSGFPELIAGFAGQVGELQRTRLSAQGRAIFRFPACLFLTGAATSANVSAKTAYWRNSRCLRVFGNFRPLSNSVTDFVNNWFT